MTRKLRVNVAASTRSMTFSSLSTLVSTRLAMLDLSQLLGTSRNGRITGWTRPSRAGVKKQSRFKTEENDVAEVGGGP